MYKSESSLCDNLQEEYKATSTEVESLPLTSKVLYFVKQAFQKALCDHKLEVKRKM